VCECVFYVFLWSAIFFAVVIVVLSDLLQTKIT